MKTNRLKVVAGGSPLARRLGLRYVEVKFKGRLEACVWTFEELNQVIGSLAVQYKLDILQEGVSVLVAEQGSGLCPTLGDIMSVIASFEPGSGRRKNSRYQFRLKSDGQRGTFSGPGLANQEVSSLYGSLVLIDMATEEHGLDPDVGIRLLQAVVCSGLPLYSAEDAVFVASNEAEEFESCTSTSSATTPPGANPDWFGLTLGSNNPNNKPN